MRLIESIGMTEEKLSLEAALEQVAHPDLDAIVKGWNKVANKDLGSLTPEEWHAGRSLAQQNTLLRTAYCMFKEGFLDHSHRFTITPEGECKPSATLSSAEEVVDYLYTRDMLQHFDLRLEGFGNGPMAVNDINVLWNDVLKPRAEAIKPRDGYNWNLAQYELLDSLNNETLSMARRVKLFRQVQEAQKDFSNGWEWLSSEHGLPKYLEETNRKTNNPDDKRDEALFLQEIAALSGHRMHPMAHTRTRLEGELDNQGRIIQDENGASPVSSLTVEEVLENGGAFGLANHLPVAALHVKEAKIRAVAREGVDNPVNGVGTLAPEKYRERFQQQHPDAYAAWKGWIKEQGQKIEDYVPLPVHSLNVDYIKTFKPFTEGLVDGKPSLLIPPPERQDISLPAMTTSATRTMAPILSSDADHMKLPIPVQVTSVRRHLAPARVFSAPVISNLLESIVGVQYGDGAESQGEDLELKQHMKIIPEPLGIYWDDKGDAERYTDAYFLGCITRENPARFASKDQVLLELNALFERTPFTGKPLAVDILSANGKDTPEGALEWFRDYADTVVKGQVGLLARYGLGMEAHQQNTLILLNKKTGKLDQTVNRDFADGLFIAEPLLKLRGKDISGDIHEVKKYLDDDVTTATKQVYHGMVASHLFPLVRVLAQECGMDAGKALASVRESIQQTFTAARDDFAKQSDSKTQDIQFNQLTDKMEKWLNQGMVREKALLTMRLDQTFEAPPLYRDNLLKERTQQSAGMNR